MIKKEKSNTKRLFSYDDYLREFLKVDPHPSSEQTIRPYDLGINLANKDISELKKTLHSIGETIK